MAMSFRNRVLATVFMSCVICTTAAIVVSAKRIEHEGEAGLVSKSQAILSRLEASREYVAGQGTLDTVISETTTKYPEGELPKDAKLKVLKSVPIFAAMQIGAKDADKESYRFRIFADEARNPDYAPTAIEAGMLQEFARDPGLKEIVRPTAEGDALQVIRPIYLSEEQGCMSCHGHPKTSPWGNGKDVLGYDMENWQDGKLHGAFAIVSELAPVHAEVAGATWSIVQWGALFTLAAMVLAWFVVRRSVRSLDSISHRLDGAGVQVAQAASQLAASSEVMSSGATESAASLEETAASMEEISSMVKQNAQNADQASLIAVRSSEIAAQGEQEVGKLISSMNEIAEDSRKIEEIIKVIDSIAFQTNLLALNAAVEAARAGDQGKGFAVVAEAVRTLAQQSAGAAKRIGDLIKESVRKSAQGADVASSSGKVLAEIVGQVKKVQTLVSEIASAAQEQSRGVEQVRTALNELDRSTQTTAAASEETAASSEELSAQSESLKGMVNQLMMIINGAATGPTPSLPEHQTGGTPPVRLDRVAKREDIRRTLGTNGQGKAPPSSERIEGLSAGDDFFQ